jgi:predicted  nucleic acid-binding Zn-ribbon protein
VVVEGNKATIEDLGSRNGLRVNDHMIVGIEPLHDGDRIRIGTQDLILSEVDTLPGSERKATGFLCQCAKCHTPYPQEMQRCPNCGCEGKESEQVQADELDDSGRRAWALQLLVEMVDKAISHGRAEDAERILGQVVLSVDERIKTSGTIDIAHVDALGEAAVALSRLQRNGKWAKWALQLHERSSQIPSAAVAEGISKLPRPEIKSLAPAVAALLKSVPAGRSSPSEIERLERLRELTDAMGEG